MIPKLVCKKVNLFTGEQFPTKKEIASFANKLLNDYCRKFNKNINGIDFDEFIYNYLKIDIKYQKLSKDKSILGATIKEDGFIETISYNSVLKIIPTKRGDIFIDSEACGCPQRELFTIFHEIKHLLLDLDKDLKVDKIIDEEQIISGSFKVKTNYGWAEYFANYFAACIILSQRRLKKLYFEKHERYITNYHTNLNGKNISFLKTIIREISEETGASQSSIAIRLKEIKLISDCAFNRLDYKFGKRGAALYRLNRW